MAIAKLSPTAQLGSLQSYLDNIQIHREIIQQNEGSMLLLLSGGTEVVEQAIAHFRLKQQLLDVVMSTIAV